MNLEQKVFLSLMKDYVNQTVSTVLSKKINWGKLYKYSEQHSLLGVCYVQLKKLSQLGMTIPFEEMDRFHKGLFSDIYVSVNQEVGMNDLIYAFHKNGISFLPFKGWVIRNYWPVPELRTMGDIDILIHSENREACDSIMKSLSYHRFIDNPSVWTYHQKDMLIEVHNHMFYEHLMNNVDYVDYFDNAWKYANRDLDESFHFIYLITHMAKHTINQGMGFRAYMDLVFFCRQAEKRLRWDWISAELKKLKLYQFTETCFAFCQIWFDFKPPLPVREFDLEFYSFVTDKLFSDGIFGLHNIQNEAAYSAKEIAHMDALYYTGAIKLTAHRVFPPYEEMRLVPWYSFVNKRPWLLPFAWVYRWGYCLIHKQEQSKDLLTEPFVKRDIIEKRQKLIRDWGLLD